MTVDQENAVQTAPEGETPSDSRLAESPAAESRSALAGGHRAESPSAAPAPPAAEISPEPAGIDPGLRARLVGQFERWLDDTLAAEPPPRGLPAELLRFDAAEESGSAGEADLYSLFSALTALTGETRLQGRAFKQLSDVLAPLAESAPALEKLPDGQRELAETIAEAVDRLAGDGDNLAIPGEQICHALIDLYDRLERGLRACRQGLETIQAAQPSGVFWRLAGGPAFARRAGESATALRDACALLLARLQSALQEWGIERIGNAGEPFDPRRMTVVDVRPADAAKPGAVVEVLRSGYAFNGTVRAVARVAVASDPPAGGKTQ